jgi:hypothetical protein
MYQITRSDSIRDSKQQQGLPTHGCADCLKNVSSFGEILHDGRGLITLLRNTHYN